MIRYTVKRGDTLGEIAKRYKLASYRDIYDHASNEAFRRLRPNPALIQPGDVINIPVDEEDEEPEAPPAAPGQGDSGTHPPGSAPEGPKRQEASPRLAETTTVLSDSFWVDQKRWAPTRPGNVAQWFVDGEGAMASMAAAFGAATKFIYITDWWITPAFHLLRNGVKLDNADRLIDILTAAATRGVEVRVMLWQSSAKLKGPDTGEVAAEKQLEKAHAKIRVSLHSPPSYWSHHQKTIVVDGTVAFVGGLDVTTGRWDSQAHPLNADPKFFNAADFYSPNIENADRSRNPRMPWHDVHMRVEGPAAFDVERNFVDRWNFQRGTEAALTLSRAAPATASGRQQVQIIRSVGAESAGVTATEASINDAYLAAIRNAQHYIYIENQFFTSNFGTGTVVNEVANTIATRIGTAIDKKEKFRVIVVLPVHPEGLIDDWTTQETLHWQYQTIVRSGANSLIGQVRARLGKPDVSDYLAFFNLRGHGTVGTTTVTEQVYVHAKLMIVDDRVAIIGSANINDRSLLGNRDSELSAIVIDEDTKTSVMDGKEVLVRTFAQDLRLALWKEHLGLKSTAAIQDPIVDTVYKDIWCETARENTRIFERVFPNIPRDTFTVLRNQQRAAALDASKVGDLAKVRGTLTLFPLGWLRDEDLETSGMPDNIFTRRDQRGRDRDIT